MNWPLTGLLIILLLAVWLFVRSRRATRSVVQPRKTDTREANTTYHAVSIKFSSSACDAAKEMEGRRFLSTAAPRLPLAGCQALNCNCRFVHHKDRRSGQDRRSPFAPSGFGGGTGKYQQEKRKGKDRRASRDDDLL